MSGAATERARPLAPLRHRSFRWLVAGRFVTFLGNGLAPIALGFAVLDLTGSVTDLALVVGARSVANVAFMLLGGVLADRFSRTALLRGAAVLAATSQVVVAAGVLSGAATVPGLVALSVVNGAAAAVALPAAAALTPQTVPAAELQPANVLVRLAVSSGLVLGAAAGGIVVAAVGPGWGILADAASFALSAVCYSMVRVPKADRPRQPQHPLTDLREGWAEFRSRPWVWTVVAQFMVVNACIVGAVSVLGPLVADQTVGRHGWGFVLAAETAGLLVGGLIAFRLHLRHALRFGVALIALEAVPLLVLAEAPRLFLLIPAMLLSGLALEVFSVTWDVALQENVPSERLGRVYSYDALGSFVAIPLGQIAVGPLALAFGTEAVLLAAAALVVGASAASLASPSVRRLTRTDPLPGPAAEPAGAPSVAPRIPDSGGLVTVGPAEAVGAPEPEREMARH